jgi:aldose 1-epimerase
LTPPSGQQYVLRHGAHRAVVTEVGAGLRHYTVDGQDVIDGYAEEEMCQDARGAALLPWPNRIQDGRYEFDGKTHQTALTEPSRQNAIHGLTRWVNWTARVEESDRVSMALALHPQEGYPFSLALEIEYRLDASGLHVRTTAVNRGATPLPYGAGHHPYLTVGTPRIDEAMLRIPALMRLEADDRLIPTGRLRPVRDTAYDFLDLRAVGDIQMDTAFANLTADADGLIRVYLQAPGGNPRVTLWMDASYAYLQVFTGDGLPAPRRRRSVALEPMTCAPNAFRTGDGLRVLRPGASVTTIWGISPSRP